MKATFHALLKGTGEVVGQPYGKSRSTQTAESRTTKRLHPVALVGPLHLVPTPPCLPEDFMALFDFLDSIAHITLFGGVGIATVTLLTGAAMIAGPFGQNIRRQGRALVKYSVGGLILLLVAHVVVGFLVGELGPTFCPE